MRGERGPPHSKEGAVVPFCPHPTLGPHVFPLFVLTSSCQKLREVLLHLLRVGNSGRWAALPPEDQVPWPGGHGPLQKLESREGSCLAKKGDDKNHTLLSAILMAFQ